MLGLCWLWWRGRGDLLGDLRLGLIRLLLGGLLLRDEGVEGVELVVDGRLLGAILLLVEELLVGGEIAGDALVECINDGGGGRVLVWGSGGGELLLYAGEMVHVESGGFHYDWGHFRNKVYLEIRLKKLLSTIERLFKISLGGWNEEGKWTNRKKEGRGRERGKGGGRFR